MKRSVAASLALLFAPIFLFAPHTRVLAGSLFCPKTVFCKPRQPCVHYKYICPQPIDPCGLENFGWYRTCWNPWPFPPNFAHCPCPPGGMTSASDKSGQSTPTTAKEEQPGQTPEELPQPNKDEPDMTPKGQPEALPKIQPEANPPKPPADGGGRASLYR